MSLHGSMRQKASTRLESGKRTQTPSPCPTPHPRSKPGWGVTSTFVFRNVRSKGEDHRQSPCYIPETTIHELLGTRTKDKVSPLTTHFGLERGDKAIGKLLKN
jgi:hypothetical protein